MNLDAADLKMARVCVNYYISVLRHMKRDVPPPALRLLDHVNAVAEIGQEPVAAQQQWLTTGEVAQRRGCSKRTAQRIAERVGHKVGHIWIIPADAIEEDDV